MGSPNFNTITDLLNVGFDYGLPDENCDDDDVSNEDSYYIINEIKIAFETWLNQQGDLLFHNIVCDSGYYSGLQIYLETSYQNRESYISQTVDDWKKYKCFAGIDGYDVEIQSCVYFRRDIKNITPFELDRAIKREHRDLHNALLEFAKENNLGEIVGKSWTSSLADGIFSKKITRLS